MIIYDFEVFKYDWLVVFKNLLTSECIEIVNDVESLRSYYEANKSSLFIGYNNAYYDDFIFKSIMLGLDPYHVTHVIIELKNKSRLYRMANWQSITLYTYDVMQALGYSSLKENEGYLGLPIDECEISFKLNRRLDESEIKSVIEYCKRDVEATEQVFYKTKNTFESMLYLVKEFNLDKTYLTKDTISITSEILGTRAPKKWGDEHSPLDLSNLKINIKNKEILDYFSGEIDYKKNLKCVVNDVPHVFGWGGIHGARDNYSYTGEIWVLDVTSFYPYMMIEYNYISRSIREDKKQFYKDIVTNRVSLKKTNPRRADSHKLVINKVYGGMKYEYCGLYDPRMANYVCATGQLLLIDLVYRLSECCTLIQSNTDGIIIIPHEGKHDDIDRITKEWEHDTRMTLEKDIACAIYQKDVNNYILKLSNGKVKVKGAFVRQYDDSVLRRTNRIIDKAVVEYYINGTDVSDYINSCNDVLDFQIITKTGNTFTRTIWDIGNGDYVEVNKVNRVYAVKGCNYGKVYKEKPNDKGGISKHAIASLPPSCLVDNSATKISLEMLDKEWYIQVAKDRIEKYEK